MNADRPSRLDTSLAELRPAHDDPPPPARRPVAPDTSVQQRFEDAMTRSQEARARQGRADVLTPSMLFGLDRLRSPSESALTSRTELDGPSDAESAAPDAAARESGRQGAVRGARHDAATAESARTRLHEPAATMAKLGTEGTETRPQAESTVAKAHVPLAEAGATLTQAFGLVSAGFRADLSAPASDRSALNQRLTTVVAGLYVGEGAHGGKQVRLDLKDEALPGVTVAIEEIAGRMQIDFTCSVETSRLRLNEAVPEVAPDLAGRLNREVLMRVQTDDEEDRCLLEVAASPQSATG